MEEIANFRKEEAETNWIALLPKVKLLSTKEGDSRIAIQDLLKMQAQELTTFCEEIGIFNYLLLTGYHHWFPGHIIESKLEYLHIYELISALLQTKGKMKIVQRLDVSWILFFTYFFNNYNVSKVSKLMPHI